MNSHHPELRRNALRETIQQRIERFIIESGGKPGDPLPAQQELARALGISVPSLREAMKSLEALGVLEVRHGSGTYVSRFSLDAMVDGLAFRVKLEAGGNARTVSELLDVRATLEQTYIRDVVTRATAEQIAALYAVVESMEDRARVGEDFATEDWQFHELLYRTVNNHFLTMLIRAFWDVVELVKQELIVAPESGWITANEHRGIVDAISAGDADGASRAMGAHFSGVRGRLERSGRRDELFGSSMAATSP